MFEPSLRPWSPENGNIRGAWRRLLPFWPIQHANRVGGDWRQSHESPPSAGLSGDSRYGSGKGGRDRTPTFPIQKVPLKYRENFASFALNLASETFDPRACEIGMLGDAKAGTECRRSREHCKPAQPVSFAPSSRLGRFAPPNPRWAKRRHACGWYKLELPGSMWCCAGCSSATNIARPPHNSVC
jgi:hypothetical protein